MRLATYQSEALLPFADVWLLGLETAGVRQHLWSRSTLVELAERIHRQGKQAMVWVNRLIFEPELEAVLADLTALAPDLDGLLLMDLGLMPPLRARGFTKKIIAHTDTTLTNTRDAQLLLTHGFDQVVSARELNREEIRVMGKALGERLIVPVFGHSLMATSRRPFLSSYGKHAGLRLRQHVPYRLREAKRQDDLLIVEDATGSHIFDQGVYWAVDEIPDLEAVGVQDFLYDGFLLDEELLRATLAGAPLAAIQANFPQVRFNRGLLDQKTTVKKAVDAKN